MIKSGFIRKTWPCVQQFCSTVTFSSSPKEIERAVEFEGTNVFLYSQIYIQWQSPKVWCTSGSVETLPKYLACADPLMCHISYKAKKKSCIVILSKPSLCLQYNMIPCSGDQQLAHLGQVGRFSHSIHTTKSDDKRSPLALSLHHISEDIHPPLWLQDLHQRVLQGLLYRGGHSYKHTFV